MAGRGALAHISDEGASSTVRAIGQIARDVGVLGAGFLIIAVGTAWHLPKLLREGRLALKDILTHRRQSAASKALIDSGVKRIKGKAPLARMQPRGNITIRSKKGPKP